MHKDCTLIERIKYKFPKLYVTEITNDELVFEPECDEVHVEYKRTLVV